MRQTRGARPNCWTTSASAAPQTRCCRRRGFAGMVTCALDARDGRAPMTEADARVLLHNWPSVGGLEAWIAGRRWKAVPGGWTVSGELEGWQFRVGVIA